MDREEVFLYCITHKNDIMKKRNGKIRMVWRAIAGIVGCLAMAAAASALVMLLWNQLLPEIAGCAEIGFWQAAGLFVLCRLLTGRLFPRHGAMRRRGGHHEIGHWHRMSPQKKREVMQRYLHVMEEEGKDSRPENVKQEKCRYGYGEMGYEQ